MTSVIVANHGRDITKLRDSLPRGVELFEVNTGLERSAQRNIGIRHCKGDVVIWMDSDQYFGPGTVKECEFLLKLGYSAVYIPEVITDTSLFGRIRCFERKFYTGTAIDVPKAVLRRYCPLFNETITGPEDAEWGNRIKGMRAIGEKMNLVSPQIAHDFIYVEDIVDAYMDIEALERCKGEAFNLGTGNLTTLKELVYTMQTIKGTTPDLAWGAFPQKHWDTTFSPADITKSKEGLGWQAKTSLEEGLRKTWNWYKKNCG